MQQRRGNVSDAWSWIGSHDLTRAHAGPLFRDVQVATVPTVVEHTADELTAILRTASPYWRLSPQQRQAVEDEHTAIYERLRRPIRSSMVAVLVTARRRAGV